MKDTILFSADPIVKLNDISLSISPGILFFYQYNPKYYDESMDDKGKLWMGITNIYTLFYDCGSFLFRGKNGSLLELFQKYGYMKKSDAKQLGNFIFSIREIRGYYCHNKIENYNNMPSKWEKSGISYIETIMNPDALRNKLGTPDYAVVCKALKQKVEEIYGIIFQTVEKIKQDFQSNSSVDESIIQKWLSIQASWLLETEEIRQNCIRSWYSITYMSVFRKLNPPHNLINDFVKGCDEIIQKSNSSQEVITALRSGKVTILDVYQTLYDNHEKEIKESMKNVQRI